jgi:predicted ATPase/class 3 adenylate cyclase
MPEHPPNRTALLFSDIEGSTRLLQRLGQAYPQVLSDHFSLIIAAVRRVGGRIVNTMGDGVFAAFATVPSAVEAAMAAQRSLVAHKWPPSGIVRVRMGMHIGAFAVDEPQFIGLDVHRAARICDAAHGGQILVSNAAASLCEGHLTQGMVLSDLGLHTLKDIDLPEHIFQVTAPGLLAEFPPPRSRNVRPHNLPSEVTDFVGRPHELAEIRRLLGMTRLLTLVGPGGTGKTRLALRVATEVLPKFEGGVYFVPLDAIRDPERVGTAIGRSLGINETETRPVLEVILEYLATKKLLLVLDNFEQVLTAAPIVSQLLAGCAELKVLLTSRALLHIAGERVFEVLPLDLPAADIGPDPARLATVSSVDLFVRRATASQPGFALTRANAGAVAQIVTRLDGLPLAIELAAVRTRLFPPEVLAKRLDQRFKALGGGLRGASAHHRTLRDAIAWSYDLLNPEEQAIFRRLGIFVGGFTVEAAEYVAAGEPSADVIEVVSSLLDKSLLRSGILQGEARLTMLETVREFALEELEIAGERQRVAGQHVAYFLQLADEIESHLTGRAELVAIDRLTAEHANIRSALRTCLDRGNAETGLRICAAIWRFWHATGQISEGRQWFNQLLSGSDLSAAVRAKGLVGLAGLAYWQAEYPKALRCYQEALTLYRSLGDRLMEADALYSMSTTLTWSGDADAGGRFADEALAIFNELGARGKAGEALMAQGFARWMKNDLGGARPLWEASLAIARDTGDHVEAATKLLALASIKFQQGEERQALNDALTALKELVALKHVTYTIMAMDFVAALSANRRPNESVRLAGAAGKLRAVLGGGMRPEASGLKSTRSIAGRSLDSATIDRLWAEGEALKLEEAITFALGMENAIFGQAAVESLAAH